MIHSHSSDLSCFLLCSSIQNIAPFSNIYNSKIKDRRRSKHRSYPDCRWLFPPHRVANHSGATSKSFRNVWLILFINTSFIAIDRIHCLHLIRNMGTLHNFPMPLQWCTVYTSVHYVRSLRTVNHWINFAVMLYIQTHTHTQTDTHSRIMHTTRVCNADVETARAHESTREGMSDPIIPLYHTSPYRRSSHTQTHTLYACDRLVVSTHWIPINIRYVNKYQLLFAVPYAMILVWTCTRSCSRHTCIWLSPCANVYTTPAPKLCISKKKAEMKMMESSYKYVLWMRKHSGGEETVNVTNQRVSESKRMVE